MSLSKLNKIDRAKVLYLILMLMVKILFKSEESIRIQLGLNSDIVMMDECPKKQMIMMLFKNLFHYIG